MCVYNYSTCSLLSSQNTGIIRENMSNTSHRCVRFSIFIDIRTTQIFHDSYCRIQVMPLQLRIIVPFHSTRRSGVVENSPYTFQTSTALRTYHRSTTYACTVRHNSARFPIFDLGKI